MKLNDNSILKLSLYINSSQVWLIFWNCIYKPNSFSRIQDFQSLPHIFNIFSKLSKDINIILILTILQAIQYYATGQYNKFFCRTWKLRNAKYVSKVIIQNHLHHIQKVFYMLLSILLKLEQFFLQYTKLCSSQ